MKKFLKALGVWISSLALFISSFWLIILLPIKYVTNPSTITNMFKSVDIESLVSEDKELHDTVSEVLEPIITDAEKLGIKEDTIIKIVNSKEIKGMIAGVTGNLVDYTLTGQKYELISIDQIKDLVNDAIDVINESGYYEISNKEKESILNIITEERENIEEIIPDTNIIEEKIPNDYKEILSIVRFVFSKKLVIYLTSIFLISLLGIVILKWKEAKWLKNSAITILMSSLVILLSFTLLIVGSKILVTHNTYIVKIIQNIFKYNLITSAVISVVMFIIIIAYNIWHKKKMTKN